MILVVALPNAMVGQKAAVGQGLPNYTGRDYRNGKFTCDECGIPAKREVMNEWHMQSAHVLGRIVCDRCGGLVRKGRNVKSHMKRNHRNRKFTCHECGIPAKREVMNEWHMQSAHVLGRIVCDCCGRMSGGLDGKGRHIGRVHGEPPVDLGQRVRGSNS